MNKSVVLSALLLTFSSICSAELIFTEKVRTVPTSLVNPDIERLAIPPTPNNMKLPEFGKGIIGWGSGPEGAQARLNNVTASDVEVMKEKGVTLDMLNAWQVFYTNETNRNAGNPTAPIRAQLMKKIIELW